MPNQAKIMKEGIVLSTVLVALLLRSSPVLAQPNNFFIWAMHSGKCMQVDGASQDDGATVSQWDCLQQPNVLWHFRGGPPGGFFNLEASHSGKCAVVPTDTPQFEQSNGAPIIQWNCQYNDPDSARSNKLYRQQDVGGGYYFIINKASNKCLQVNGGSLDNGATISQWECVDQPNVKWKIPLYVAHPID
jgi:hypothetical protein